MLPLRRLRHALQRPLLLTNTYAVTCEMLGGGANDRRLRGRGARRAVRKSQRLLRAAEAAITLMGWSAAEPHVSRCKVRRKETSHGSTPDSVSDELLPGLLANH
jgi:hypothetical protein